MYIIQYVSMRSLHVLAGLKRRTEGWPIKLLNLSHLDLELMLMK